jgi:SAM-dependent methyltransferase
MHGSNANAALLEQWEKTRRGSFALEQEKKLILSLIANWRRRHQSLLDVGCGTGIFLETLWEAGFSVSGLDCSPDMLARARSRLGRHADLHLGWADDLPFEDNEFDYVVLVTLLEFSADPVRVMKEAARVCKKEMLVGFLNRFSWYYLTNGLSLKKDSATMSLKTAHWRSWPELRRLIVEAVGQRDMHAGSVLPGPKCSWRKKVLCHRLNSHIYPPFCGAFGAVVVDLSWKPTGTPLLAWAPQPKAT